MYSKHVTALVKHVTAVCGSYFPLLVEHIVFSDPLVSEMFHPDWQERRGLNERRRKSGEQMIDVKPSICLSIYRVRTGHGMVQVKQRSANMVHVQGKQRSANGEKTTEYRRWFYGVCVVHGASPSLVSYEDMSGHAFSLRRVLFRTV